MNIEGYERLMRDHAYWAGQVQALKQQSSDTLNTIVCNHDGRTCIGMAYQECRELNQDCGPDDGYSFEEIWHELDCQGKVCDGCKGLRRLKAERIVASRRLGAVRAAITRVGRNLMKEDS